MKVIVVTGGIASGKSTVVSLLREIGGEGMQVFDCDSAVEELQNSGKICYSVGYNIDMLAVAPDAALTSAQNVWSVLYQKTLEKFGFSPDEAIVVGDTVFDINMGRNARTATCGVTYGNGSRESLAHADCLIDNFSQLPL